MLNKSVESKHLCLVPDLRGKAFSLLPLNMMLAVGFSFMTFLIKVVSSYFYFIDVKCFSTSIEMIM